MKSGIAIVIMLCFLIVACSREDTPYGKQLVKFKSKVVQCMEDKKVNIQFDLLVEPGWKLYGTRKGDAGKPLVITAQGKRLSDLNIQLPPSILIEEEGIRQYVYEAGNVTGSISFFSSDSSIDVDIDWSVCREECVTGISKESIVLPQC